MMEDKNADNAEVTNVPVRFVVAGIQRRFQEEIWGMVEGLRITYDGEDDDDDDDVSVGGGEHMDKQNQDSRGAAERISEASRRRPPEGVV